MIVVLLILCIFSFALGAWTTGTNTMAGGFLLIVAAILAVGVAIAYTLQRIFGKDQRKQ
ncbi:MAG: hypothetical protein JSW18_05685 [Candidatus Omnitrophota bacterium]|nr:MAG: hypothetical protein JSW18_05685 [Candidatus Omnitrophota bacterium]